MSDEPDQDPEYQKRKWEADLAHWRAKVDASLQSQLAMFSGIIEFAVVAIKGIVLVNGAAAIAVLAFLGSIWAGNAKEGREAAIKLAPALEWFVWGVGLGVLTAGLAYLAQVAILELPQPEDGKGKNWASIIGGPLRLGAIVAGFAGIVMFFGGADRAITVFMGG